MSSTKSNQSTVNKSWLKGKTPAELLSALDNTCSAGKQCPEVASSPLATHALADLLQTVTAAHGSLTTRQSLAQALAAAVKDLDLDLGELKAALATYEAAVIAIAKGNAAIINGAGLPSRDQKAPPVSLGVVTQVLAKPGKHPAEAILNWPPAPGATGYAIEANFAPQSPVAGWTGLTPGSRRRRIVKAPAPGAQFLVRVAALGSDGIQSDWSDAILATAA